MANLTVLTKMGLLLGLIPWTTGLTAAALSFEEEFLQLKIQMKEIVESFEEKDGKMQKKVTEMETLLFELLQEKNERMKSGPESAPISQSAVGINGLPSSCGDLKMIGHTWNGFYSVMGPAMMESVYCDFTKPTSDAGFEKWIGYADVKSAPVNFYVQRSSTFDTSGILPFDLALANDGNAMNLTTGKFTAPRTGTYFFSFTGLAYFPSSTSHVFLWVYLYFNGAHIGHVRVEEPNTVAGQYSPLSLQSTLNMKKGDQVWVGIDSNMSTGMKLYDDGNHFTHFTGFMLQEDIAASL